MSATAHRNKRPFQPSITSYFARADRFDHDAAHSPTRADTQQQGLAPVPANVQASLLNVGMRVRKSVPEGYKTHKTVPPPTNTSAPYSKPQPHFVPTTAAAAASRPTELLPFCGLHKTGGYVVQQQQTSTPYLQDFGSASTTTTTTHPVNAHAIRFSAEDFSPFSSQESSISTDSLPATNAHKRRFDDEEDNQMAGGGRPLFPSLNTSLAVPAGCADEDDISPRTTVYPVSHTAMPDLCAGRPVAQPKSRRRNGGGGGGKGATSSGDFEEAEFLEPLPPAEWGEEVEMGGV